VRLGRTADCDFRIDHPSVSRAHAELAWQDGDWRLRDLGSKNGSFVDGVRTPSAVLGGHAWLRFGDVSCEFETLSEAAATSAEQRQTLARANSLILIEGLARHTALPDLLQETVRAAVELADCERGFLLLCRPGGLEVAASHGIALPALRGSDFRGSVGAVQRALASGEAVVVNDNSGDLELSGRASVIAGGLGALVCLPLLADGEAVGLVYADSRRPGARITRMDLDLLRAFAERASLWIAARRGIEALSSLAPPAPDWADIVDAQHLARA
jgi:transcriptional regulator with GAF, ATPase, and Fis domain